MKTQLESWMIIDENTFTKYLEDQKKLKNLKEQWKKASSKFITHRWISRFITPTQKEMLKKYYNNLTDENVQYADYKKSFNFICKFMGLNNNDLVIDHLEFKKDDKDKEVIAVCYSKGRVQIQIPKGVSLIHASPVKGITALNPSFRSKKLGNYMYANKRVFFTIMKDMPDNKMGTSSVQTYRYRTKQDYSMAYIDPTYNTFGDRAIYIETDKPIPVQPYETYLDELKRKILGLFTNKKDVNAEKNDVKKESTITSITEDEAFNNTHSIEILNEWSFNSFMNDLKRWKLHNENNSKQTFSSNNISDEEFEQFEECMRHMKEEESYGVYKQWFSKFCRMAHILPTGTVIYEYSSKKNGNNENYISITYAYNIKKINIPKECKLYHMSKVPGIKALNPSFRSKEFNKTGSSRTQYFYSSPRVYLTLNKFMIKWFADYDFNDEVNKYIVVKPITQAYVDPLVPGVLNKAIYVETNTPIKVMTLEDYEKTHKAEIEEAKEDEKQKQENSLLTTLSNNDITIIQEYSTEDPFKNIFLNI